jgi:hypothetical protein
MMIEVPLKIGNSIHLEDYPGTVENLGGCLGTSAAPVA